MAIEVGSAFVSIIPSFKGFGRELNSQLAAQTKNAGKTVGQTVSKNVTGGFAKAGKGASDLGSKLNRSVTLPLAGMGGLAFKAFGDFDQTMRQVGVQTGLTGKQLDSFSQLAIKTGQDTSFSAGQAADAMLELAKGGLTSAQIKGGALAETMTLAAAGGVSLDDAAGTLANTMNTFGLQAKDAGQVTAALAGGANASTASVGSLSQALSQVGPGAKLAGLSVQDTVSALAAFDNAGIKGSDAGTSLKTMLMNLTPQTDKAASMMEDLGLASFSGTKAMDFLRGHGIKPLGTDYGTLRKQLMDYVVQTKGVKPGSVAAQKAFDKLAASSKILGTEFYDNQGKMKPMREIAGALQDSMKGLTKEQQSNALTTMFGSDAYRAAAVLASTGAGGIDKLHKATTDLGTAQKLAKTNTDGAKGSIEQLKGSVETAAIQMGTTLAPTVTDLAKQATNLVNKFGALSPETQKNALIAGALAAALGPVTSAFGKTAKGISDTAKAAKTVGGGLKSAGTGIAGFSQGLRSGQSGLSAFSGKAQTFGSFLNRGFSAAFTALRGPVVAAAGAVKAFGIAIMTNPIGIAVVAIAALVGIGILLYQRWAPFRAFIDAIWAGMKQLAATIAGAAVSAFHGLVAAAQSVWAALQTGWGVFQRLLAVVTPIVMSIVNVITQPLQGMVEVVRGILNVFAGIFTGNWKRVGQGIAQAIGGIVRVFLGAPARVIAAIIPLLPRIGAFFKSVFSSIGKAVSSGWSATVAFFKAAPGRMMSAISSLGSKLSAFGRSALTFLKNAVVAGANAVVSYIKNFPGNFVRGLSNLGSMLSSTGSSALSSLKSAVTTGAGNVVSYMTGLPGRIVSTLSGLASSLYNSGVNMIQGFINGITGMAGSIIGAIRSAITDSLPGYVRKALGIHSPSKVFAEIGRYTVEGLRVGILTSAPRAVAAARSLVLKIGDATKSALAANEKRLTANQKALDANRDKLAKNSAAQETNRAAQRRKGVSKSRKAELKRQLDTLKNDRKALNKTRTGLKTDRTALWAERPALRKQRDAAIKDTNAVMKRLAPMMKTRDNLNAQLATATSRLAALNDAKAKVKEALTTKLNEQRDLFGDAMSGILPDPAAVQKRLTENLAKINNFAKLLKSLTAKGFSTDIVSQVASQGADAGMKMASVLNASTPAQVKAINAQSKAIGDATAATATSISSQMYDAGIHAAQGLVNGLTKKRDDINKAMAGIADALVKRIETKLKIHSPSRVFAGIGDNIGAGLEVGILDKQKAVHASIDGLVKAPALPKSKSLMTMNGKAAMLNGTGGPPSVRVFIGERELTSIVRVEVDDAQTNMARQLAYGRRV